MTTLDGSFSSSPRKDAANITRHDIVLAVGSAKVSAVVLAGVDPDDVLRAVPMVDGALAVTA